MGRCTKRRQLANDWNDASTNEETPRLPANIRSWQRKGGILPQGPQKEHSPAGGLIPYF